jgi:hypothetical protein
MLQQRGFIPHCSPGCPCCPCQTLAQSCRITGRIVLVFGTSIKDRWSYIVKNEKISLVASVASSKYPTKFASHRHRNDPPRDKQRPKRPQRRCEQLQSLARTQAIAAVRTIPGYKVDTTSGGSDASGDGRVLDATAVGLRGDGRHPGVRRNCEARPAVRL